MVLKQFSAAWQRYCQFESSVNSDGTQTRATVSSVGNQFESSVNSDGTQTQVDPAGKTGLFESSVNSDGTQTLHVTRNVCIAV